MTYDAFRAAELQGWDARADGYDDATARATVQSGPDLLAAVRLWPGARLLDVCCGPGYAAGAAAALGADAEGIDFAPAMARAARARFPGVAFAEGDAEHLAAGDASFDIVVCNFGLFHVPDPEQAVIEAFRVLRPGGRYAFSQWCAPDESTVFQIFYDAIRAHADMGKSDPAPDGFALANRIRARAVLSGAGFWDVEGARCPAYCARRPPASSISSCGYRCGYRSSCPGRARRCGRRSKTGSTARSDPMKWPVNSTFRCPA